MNASREKTELHKQPRGGLRLPFGGFLFSVLFLASGVAITGIGLGLIFYDPNKIHAPRWVITLFGLMFLATGLYLAAVVLLTVKRHRLAKGISQSVAWRYDYPWSRYGITDETGKTVAKTFIILIAIGVFLVPFHAVFLFNPESRTLGNMIWVAYLVLGLFDIFLLGGMIYAVYLVLRRLRFGRTRILFSSFPYYLGGNLDVSFEGGKKLANRSKLDVTLRCVEEVFEVGGHGRHRRLELVCYQIYHDQRVYATDRDGRASFSFPLPAEMPGTQLIESPPTYWELVVRAAMSGVDY